MKRKSTKKDLITSSTTELINNISVIIFCEHCDIAVTHEELGENGACPHCKKEIRKELF